MPPDAELLKVAIIGAPNAGKSTFVNRLMGWRVSLINQFYMYGFKTSNFYLLIFHLDIISI